MPDHVHFFAKPARDAESLAEWMKTWKSISSRRISNALRVKPPIWQRDYFDHFIRSATSYSEKRDYVSRNPIRGNLIKDGVAWPWQGIVHDLTF
jgi:REP element-mobilizing transposase RayT